jgi:hypothetical protein
MDWSTARGQAKVRYTYGAGSELLITVGSDLDHRYYAGSVIGDPSSTGVRVRPPGSPSSTGRRVCDRMARCACVNASVATDEQLSGVLDPASELGTRDPHSASISRRCISPGR